MSDKSENKIRTYIIPNNFTESGKLFNGMLSIRNSVETLIICGGLYFLEDSLLKPEVSVQVYYIILMLTTVPIGIVSIIGINGDPLSVFIKTVFLYIKNRRKLSFRRIYNEKKNR